MTTPKRVEVNWELRRRKEQELREGEIAEALLRRLRGVVAERVTIKAEFPLPATVVSTLHAEDARVVVTSLRVEATRYSGRRNDDDEGYVRVEMFAQAAKADGTPHGGRRPSWISAPQDLAGPLLLAALTRSLIPSKEN